VTDVVSVDTAAGPSYTWASASFTWGSAAAGKNWGTAYPAVYALGVAVALGFSEFRTNGSIKGLSDPIGFADGDVRDFLLSQSETFAFSETYADLISYIVHFLESLPFTETAPRSFQKEANEAIEFVESAHEQFQKWFYEALGFAETYTDLIDYLISVSESLAIASTPQKSVEKPVPEFFAISDARVNQIVKGIPEALAVGELLGRTVDYRRSLTEGFNFGDAMAKALAISLPEALAIADQYRRRANGVISDIVISRLEITEQDFRDILDAGHPPGYSNFRDFISGDYTYQRALFRAILETDNADRGYINGLRVTVDVPDVFDRGTAQITDASNGVYVPFSRAFHISPEVTLTHKGGTVVATPRIVGSITKSGFTAVLENSAGTRVAGSFTWVAQGY